MPPKKAKRVPSDFLLGMKLAAVRRMNPNVAISSVMHAPVRTFRPDLKVIEALQFAERCGMHHLPLLEAGKIVGLICTCDLETLDLQSSIGEAISRAAATLPAQSTAEAAMHAMVEQGVGSLLVTDNDTVVGIVTREDLSRAGLDLDEPAGFRCESCGSAKHLRTENNRGTLCIDCRAHAEPETSGDETGVGD